MSPMCLTSSAWLPCFLMVGTLVVSACATTDLAPIGATAQPVEMEADEQQLWQNADRSERLAEENGALYEDPELEAYLQDVAAALLADRIQETAHVPRIKVVKDPRLSAFALPNGAIYFHTGLLARMENEAQMATVLGHELTHFTHRHMLKEKRSAENKELFLRPIQIALALGAGELGQLVGDVGELVTIASVYGYSRDLEAEADEEGLRAMIMAGYDPQEAPKVFEHLQEDLQERGIEERFFFGTHPRLEERIEHYAELINTEFALHVRPGGSRKRTERFRERVDPLILDNAVLDLQLGRLGVAGAAIERYLQRHPDSPRAHYLMGEVHRKSGTDEERVRLAMAAYQRAVDCDPTYAPAYRELGFYHRERGDEQKAASAFRQYVDLAPGAPDAPIVQGYLREPKKRTPIEGRP